MAGFGAATRALRWRGESSQRYAQCPRTALYCADSSTAQLPMSDLVVASGARGYRCAEPDFQSTPCQAPP